jgi:hypothetical protein
MIRAYANGVWFYAKPAQRQVDYYGDHFGEEDETKECAGCVFHKGDHDACKKAGVAALAAGMPDCESRPDLNKPGFIYLKDPSNGRQLDLLEDGQQPKEEATA